MYQYLPVSRVGMEGMIIFPRNLEKANYRLVTGVAQASTGLVGECWQPRHRRFLHRSYFIETLFRSLNCTIWGTLLVKARIKALNNWIDNYTQGCRLVLHRSAGQHRSLTGGCWPAASAALCLERECWRHRGSWRRRHRTAAVVRWTPA